MYSLKTDDISPPKRPIIKPYNYGEGYEHLQPKRPSLQNPKKIMNFCLRTQDIEGAQPKKDPFMKFQTRDIMRVVEVLTLKCFIMD